MFPVTSEWKKRAWKKIEFQLAFLQVALKCCLCTCFCASLLFSLVGGWLAWVLTHLASETWKLSSKKIYLYWMNGWHFVQPWTTYMHIFSTWQDQILSLRSLQSANTHICLPYGWIPTLITASEAIVSLLRLEGTRPDQRRCITPACLNSNCSTWPEDQHKIGQKMHTDQLKILFLFKQ